MGATLAAFFLGGCDILSGPAAPTPIPANHPTSTLTPKSVVQVIASPTQAQPPLIVATTDTPFVEGPTTGAPPIPPSIVPANTPQPRDTNTPSPVSPTPTYAIGFYKCEADTAAGGGSRKWKDCWKGIVNGYSVEVSAGIQLNWGGAKVPCETAGMYYLSARLLTSSYPRAYESYYFVGCSELHIKEVSGGVVTFKGDDTYNVRILSIVETANWRQGLGGCPPKMSADSTIRTSTNCWKGVVNSYTVLVRAGEEVLSPKEQGILNCPTQGFYYVEAWAPNDRQTVQSWKPPDNWQLVYQQRFYPLRCGALRISSTNGSFVNLEDEDNQPFSVNLAEYLPTPIP